MKRILITFVLMTTCFQSVIVSAEGQLNDVFIRQAEYYFHIVEQTGIVEDIAKKWTEEDNITRGDAFEYMVRLMGFQIDGLSGVDLKSWGYSGSLFPDVESYSKESLILIDAYGSRIMHGKYDENGNIIADFDSYITKKEAVTALNRMLLTPYAFNPEPEQVGDAWYTTAKELGLLDDAPFPIEEQDEPLKAYEYFCLLYSAMFIPRYEYRSVYVKIRYIDNFIGPIVD